MARPIAYVDAVEVEAYDAILDVRSPSEYAQDHVPGAVNLPVLNDEERHEVGVLYKQADPFTARKRGASIVARNIGRHVEERLSDWGRDVRPLVYCWRGGQRSGSLALVLAQIGWGVTVLSGGYKRYRRQVIESLESQPSQFQWIMLGGLTGTAKTRLLYHLERAGEQILDLEALAHHRGSVLGPYSESQPSQKWFESQLALALARFDPSRPVWIESESHRIGEINIPAGLWSTVKGAPTVILEAPRAERARYLLSEYRHFVEFPLHLQAKLAQLEPIHGRPRIAEWQALVAAREWNGLVESLLADHYDPRYRRSANRHGRQILHRVRLERLDAETLAHVVDELRAIAPSRGDREALAHAGDGSEDSPSDRASSQV